MLFLIVEGMTKNKYAVIVAGGTGSRLGGGLPKQFRDLNGRPLVWWSMKAFHDADVDTKIILVVHPDYVDVWKNLFASLRYEDQIPHDIKCGGSSRTESVINGISDIPSSENELIAVHDAARPLVTVSLINRGWESGDKYGACVPVVPVTDSLRRINGDENEAIDRKDYVAVQTPQVFKASILKEAYQKNAGMIFTDDASATESAGWKTALFEGSPENMKVTNPGDIEVATLRLNSRK